MYIDRYTEYMNSHISSWVFPRQALLGRYLEIKPIILVILSDDHIDSNSVFKNYIIFKSIRETMDSVMDRMATGKIKQKLKE